jgi:uncharacterized RDD family membrane protein YckC
MARWTGTWLSGVTAAGLAPAEQRWPGERLGLPERGPGSISGLGRRLAAFALDAVASNLIAALFIADPASPRRGLLLMAVFCLQYLILVSLTGQTLGLRLVGLRVLLLSHRQEPPGFVPTALRTALLALLVPALVTDRDGRGLHDRAAGTAVVKV